MIALLDYCYNNERAFSRLLIIDSPLCTKYGDKNVSEEEQVTFGTIDAFARYCNMKEWNFQFIVIDNKFTLGLFYKAQIAYVDKNDVVGYYSTIGVIKCTTRPNIFIFNFTFLNLGLIPIVLNLINSCTFFFSFWYF